MMEDQPQEETKPRKPFRALRKRLSWLALPAAAAILALAYDLTRPPALVWWTSPPFGNSGRRVKLLIPRNWELDREAKWAAPEHGETEFLGGYIFRPSFVRPFFLYSILPISYEPAHLSFSVNIPIKHAEAWAVDSNR